MEDFQEKVIEQFVHEHAESLFVNSGYSVEEITQAFINMARAFETVVETLAERVQALAELFGTYNPNTEDDWELYGKREIHRLDFKRPIISHQVLDRKPKQLIKKVIH